MRPRTSTVDLRHYIGDDGECAAMPDAAFRVAAFMFAIVDWVTIAGARAEATLTNVWCRRRPHRRQCRGPIVARVEETSGSILWWCASCGERGSISNWHGTLWDRRGEIERLRDLERPPRC